MSNVIHFPRQAMQFEPYGDVQSGSASIARLVGADKSSTMGAGIARFDNTSIEWTVLYDEVIVTLEGAFTLRVGNEAHECAPGDVLWIPAQTPLHYEGRGATVFYALSPVDWRERNGLA